jgi:hypothetical protein
VCSSLSSCSNSLAAASAILCKGTLGSGLIKKKTLKEQAQHIAHE